MYMIVFGGLSHFRPWGIHRTVDDIMTIGTINPILCGFCICRFIMILTYRSLISTGDVNGVV